MGTSSTASRRINMIRKYIVISFLILTVLCAGCGKKGEEAVTGNGPKAVAVAEEGSAETQPVEAAEPAPSGEEVKEEAPASDDGENASPDETGTEEHLSLAKRLSGKYSLRSGESEYSVLEIFEFADNIYALAGEAMDDSEPLEAYSFWAEEFLPEDRDSTASETKDSFKAGILSFSIMSNLGQYQSAPQKTEVCLADDGVIIGNDHYTADERVSDSFPYMNRVGKETKLTGLFKEKKAATPIYLEFKEGNFRIYRKSADKEVLFGCGSYEADGEILSCNYSVLGNGGMPYTLKTEYFTDGDGELTIAPSEDDLSLFDPEQEYIFEPVSEKDVPVITLQDANDAGIDDDRQYDMYSTASLDYTPFYGVWLAALQYKGDAEEALEEVKKRGFDGSIVFAPDWDGLGSGASFCVTAGRCRTEEEAEKLLQRIKETGNKSGYIKYSGERTGTRVYYTLSSLDRAKISPTEVVLKGVPVEDLSGDGESITMDLVIDGSTAFDPSCDMGPFNNYAAGDSVFDWFKRNMGIIEADPDGAGDTSLTLMGVFDVSLTGQHVDRFYGSYWWD